MRVENKLVPEKDRQMNNGLPFYRNGGTPIHYVHGDSKAMLSAEVFTCKTLIRIWILSLDFAWINYSRVLQILQIFFFNSHTLTFIRLELKFKQILTFTHPYIHTFRIEFQADLIIFCLKEGSPLNHYLVVLLIRTDGLVATWNCDLYWYWATRDKPWTNSIADQVIISSSCNCTNKHYITCIGWLILS